MQVSVSRRQFLKISAGTVAAVAVADKVLALTALQPVIEVGNPLGEYPDRSWERVYHDQYRYDSSFTWCCSPNDTHGCRIRAFVRNGVVMRVEQNYDHQTYEDLYGNRGTFAHNPRMCLKGYTFHRRVYGPYRLKGPLMRKGWKEWMDAGSPELTPDVKRKYKFDSRFLDDMMRVSWDTAFTYAAKGLIIIATRYSGEAGARRLREQGYAPEMIEMMKGAGVRCFKHRAGMPVLGHRRQDDEHPIQRRSVCRCWTPGSARSIRISAQGGKYYSNYTWHGDQDPSPSLVERHAELRHRPLRHAVLQAEHQLGQELRREQDAGSPLEARVYRAGRPRSWSSRRNITRRPTGPITGFRSGRRRTGRTFSGACKIIVDENMQDIDLHQAVYRLAASWSGRIRLQYLDPRDVVADYKFPDFSKSYSGRVQSLKPEQIERLGRDDGLGPGQEAGGAAASGAGRLPLRGKRHRSRADGTYRVKLLNGREVDVMPIYQMYLVHLQDYDLDTVASDHAGTEGPDRPVGAGFRHDQAGGDA